jgi:hypothetical protein
MNINTFKTLWNTKTNSVCKNGNPFLALYNLKAEMDNYTSLEYIQALADIYKGVYNDYFKDGIYVCGSIFKTLKTRFKDNIDITVIDITNETITMKIKDEIIKINFIVLKNGYVKIIYNNVEYYIFDSEKTKNNMVKFWEYIKIDFNDMVTTS